MICLVVALPAEARPLVARLGLRPVGHGEPYRLWEGHGTNLIVSGVGQEAAAAAVDHLCRQTHAAPIDGWVNVGIAGHRSLPLGKPVLAREVLDGATGERWSVALPFEPPCRTERVLTVEQVERVFPEEVVYDMEASGFYRRAVQDALPELVQVLKVVSDNEKSDVDHITSDRVEELVAGSADLVEILLSTLAQRVGSTRYPG
jgi:adenosylhomocysteine nucleosidase